MNCKNLEKHIPDYISGDIEDSVLQEFNEHLGKCTECQQEVESLENLWLKLKGLPDGIPTPDLRHKFYSMVEAYKAGMAESGQEQKTKVLEHGSNLFFQNIMKAAAVIAFIIIGSFMSFQLYKSNVMKEAEIAHMQDEMDSLEKLVMISMLKDTSPSQRLRAVKLAAEFKDADDRVLDALFSTIVDDQNMNVKLAGIDAIYNFTDNNEVREQVMNTLITQNSPTIQIALIDLLVTIKEQDAKNIFIEMMKNEHITEE
ncbi:MAG: zf-HC2 domain-containing protein, partial [bacterium]|nr:zf-HC2 domain-containing protein [bacterium]